MRNWKASFITHAMFADAQPMNVFHKQLSEAITPHDPAFQNRHILFRKTVNLPKIQQASLFISADDYYKLSINGHFVTQGPAPGYPFAYYYNEVDVTAFLQEGENTFAVHTYYQGLINRVWVSGDLRHMLICELEADGKVVLCSDESWKCALHTGFGVAGKNFGYDTAFCESYHADAPEVGFEEADFDDTGWAFASIKQHTDYSLIPQPTLPLTLYIKKPAVIRPTKTGYFVDLGQEIVGYPAFAAHGQKGACIAIRCGEELNEDGTVRWKMRCNCDYEESFYLSGKRDEYHCYDYKGFRYFELEVPENCRVETDSIGALVRHYPFAEKIACPSAHPDLKRIWDLCTRTIQYGVQEVFMDCPTREKGQYLGDNTITAVAHTLITGDDSMMRKALREFARSSFICPGLMTIAPGSLMQEIADYSFQFPMQVWWLYRYNHDLSFLKEMLPYITGVLQYFEKFQREDGLLECINDKWNLVDWPANLRDGYDFKVDNPVDDGCHNVVNGFYCGMLEVIDQIYTEVGLSPTGKTARVKAAFVKAFWDPKTALFRDSETSTHSSIHSNILPLLFDIGIVPETKAAILEQIREKGLCMGVYMACFLLCALKRVGETELMEELLLSPKGWLKMLEEGATTCYEAWSKEEKWNTSLFHPWATVPIIALSDTSLI